MQWTGIMNSWHNTELTTKMAAVNSCAHMIECAVCTSPTPPPVTAYKVVTVAGLTVTAKQWTISNQCLTTLVKYVLIPSQI